MFLKKNFFDICLLWFVSILYLLLVRVSTQKPSLVNTNIGKHCFYNLENSLDHIKLEKNIFWKM